MALDFEQAVDGWNKFFHDFRFLHEICAKESRQGCGLVRAGPIPIAGSSILDIDRYLVFDRFYPRFGIDMADAPRKIDEAAEAQTNAELRIEIQERTLAEDVLRQLSQHIVLAQDEERKRIARELHDDIGQYLGAISMGVASLRDKVRPELRADVDDILTNVERCIRDVRTISHLLHPPLLDELGLPSALEWYVGEFARRGGIAVDLLIPPELGRLKPEIETAIFRIIQEALTNVHRHSGAQSVRVHIEKNEKVIRVNVTDNGRGISKEVLDQMAAGKSGVGVTGMRERVRELRGKFEIRPQSAGTTVYVELPLAN